MEKSAREVEPPVAEVESVALSIPDLETSAPRCRICHIGPSLRQGLIAPCRCKGSIKFVHRRCLENWLETAASEECELCRYHYTITKTPKSFWQWCGRESCCSNPGDLLRGLLLLVAVCVLALFGSVFMIQAISLFDGRVVYILLGLILMLFGAVLIVGAIVLAFLVIREESRKCKAWRITNVTVHVVLVEDVASSAGHGSDGAVGTV